MPGRIQTLAGRVSFLGDVARAALLDALTLKRCIGRAGLLVAVKECWVFMLRTAARTKRSAPVRPEQAPLVARAHSQCRRDRGC
jgi:hypothetical protein